MILDHILGSDEVFSLRHRFFNAAALCVAVAALLNAVTEYALSMGMVFYGFTLSLAAAFAILYVLGRFYRQHRVLNWPFALLCYFVVLYDWYWGGGFAGVLPQIALALSIAISVIMPGRQKAVALALMGLLIIALFVVETRFPGIVRHYGNPALHVEEELAALLSLAIILIVLVAIVVHGYNREHGKAVSGNQELTAANKRLRQMQFELEFNNARYLGIFEQMSSGVIVCRAVGQGEDFVITEFNNAAESIEGLHREAVLGQSISNLFPAIDEFGLAQVLRQVWLTGEPMRYPAAFYSDERINGWRDNYVYKLPSGEIVAIYRDITRRKIMEDELRWNEERFRNLFQDSPTANFLMEGECFVDCNQAAVEMLGLQDKHQVVGKRLWELSSANQPGGTPSKDQALDHLAIVLKRGSHRFEWLHQSPDGREVPVEVLMTRISHRGKILLHSSWNDISKRKEAEKALKDREIRYRTLFESSSDAVMLLREDIGYISANQAVLRMFELDSEDQFIGLFPGDLSPDRQPNGENSAAEARWMMDLAMRKGGHEFEWVHKRAGGEEFYAAVRLTPMVIDGQRILQASVRDISESKRVERQLRELATTDSLTGANNRRKFMDLSSQELARSKRYGSPLSILLLDIDRFKAVNDTFGHDAGDEVLRALVKTCLSNLRETDIFGRLGGEEFGVLLIETDPETALATAERLRRALADNEVPTRSGMINCTVSVGQASLGQDETNITIAELLKRADMALYEAKRAGRNCVKSR